MIIVGLDPGPEQSALVAYDGTKVGMTMTDTNEGIREVLVLITEDHGVRRIDGTKIITSEPVMLVMEMVESYGMPVGREILRTVWWTGRFAEVWRRRCRIEIEMPRRDVKQHLCFSARATDANIRQALYDRFGPGRGKAVGTKKAPGPLYGVKAHEMSALAVAITYWDRQQQPGQPLPVVPPVVTEF